MAGHEVVRKVLSVRQWQTIDAILDNLAATEQVDGDPSAAQRAGRLREVGWDALHSHPQAGQGTAGWPPDDSPFDVALTADDWDFARLAVERSTAVIRILHADSEPDSRVRQVHAAALALGEDVLDAL